MNDKTAAHPADELLEPEELEAEKETREEFDALAEAEAEAKKADEDEPEAKEDPPADPPADPEAKEDPPADPEKKTEGEPEPGDDPEKKAAEAEDDKTGESEEEDPPAASAARQPDPLPEKPDHSQRLTEIRAEIRAAAEKHDQGDITSVDMTEMQEALREERMKLNREVEQYERQVEQHERDEANRQQTFNDTAVSFLREHKDQYATGSAGYLVLNSLVIEMQNAEGADPHDPGIIQRAHAKAQKLLNGGGEGEEKPENKDLPKRKQTGPLTLANAPKSSGGGLEDTSLSYLEKLDGEELEEALEKLTPGQYDKWLESGG